MTNHLVDIIVPTWNNPEYLRPMLQSLLRNNMTAGLFHVWVVNNGEADSVEFIPKDHPLVTVLQPESNLKWEGGLNFALEQTTAPFVVFCNDDVHFPTGSRFWLHNLMRFMDNPVVGAVGPSSNVVMGSQNIFWDSPYDAMRVKYLIGFCVLHRREALDKIKETAWLDESLPGGDDMDWSIRLRQAGYDLVADRTTFIYHHGFKSGTRLVGNYWNSADMTEKTNQALIRKHGLKAWFDCMYHMEETINPYADARNTEAEVVRAQVVGPVIYELGCGAELTVPEAIGVDIVPEGEIIGTLEGEQRSKATILADVSGPLPIESDTADTVIARHVLEHVVDTIATLKEWGRILKRGGRLIIAVPDETKHLTVPLNIEHKHAYTPESLLNVVEAAGFIHLKTEDSGNNIGFVGVFEK